ncbi:late embryogenesis abundant protein At1g64065 [Silene latifolia]|uniref:late embryogenesis abundant protein At1g64065 n=1 Tax=Silene latifolia TaxID=37657 RepID=UPI003D76DFA4
MVMANDQAQPPSPKNPKPNSTRRCCWLLFFLGALLTLIILIVIILIFTVFKVKNPIMTINKIRLGSGNATGLSLAPGSNITMFVETSVKNPNLGAFAFHNTTSTIFYGGIMVGQAYGPPGLARAQKSISMNITVELVTGKLLSAPNLSRDLGSGLFTMDSNTVAPGKVKLIIKKRVVVEMNCTVTFNITSQAIVDQKCKSHVDF